MPLPAQGCCQPFEFSMPLTTILYILMFVCAVGGAIFLTPFYGLLGYLATYHVNPVSHWWGEYVPSVISRYSLILGSVTLLGCILHLKKLKFIRLFDLQEWLILILVIFSWFSMVIGLNLFSGIDESIIKITKIFIIVFIASHLITDLKKYEIMVYVFIVTGLFLGVETYTAPSYMFAQGRLEGGIGGSDLSNGNMLAAHFALVLSFIGVMFLTKGWKTKLLCLVSAAFIVNGIILIRSRGSFLGLAVGAMAAFFFAKRVSRKKITIILLAGCIGAFSLVDTGFLERMKLIQADTETMDYSAKSRLDVWLASFMMIEEYPFGVGVGNTKHLVGDYIPALAGLDTHNTYLRCLTDMGYHGLFTLLFLIGNSFRNLSLCSKMALSLRDGEKYQWHIFALKVATISCLVILTFVSATYTEEFYWLMMFPIFIKRAIENEMIQLRAA